MAPSVHPGLTCHPSEPLLISSSLDGTIRIWRLDTFELVKWSNSLYPTNHSITYTPPITAFRIPHQSQHSLYPTNHSIPYTPPITTFLIPHQSQHSVYPTNHNIPYRPPITTFLIPHQSQHSVYPTNHNIPYTPLFTVSPGIFPY